MGYSEDQSTTFTYFTDREHTLIQEWLTAHGHTWQTNTVCGDCCGMYEDAYWVNGIGGKFPDSDEFVKFAADNGIGCKVDTYRITAKAEGTE